MIAPIMININRNNYIYKYLYVKNYSVKNYYIYRDRFFQMSKCCSRYWFWSQYNPHSWSLSWSRKNWGRI